MSVEPSSQGGYPTGQPFPPPPPTPTRTGRGCLFWGCLVLVLLLLVIVGVAGFGIYLLRSQYTAPAPQAVPEYQPKPGEVEAAERRIDQFERAGAPAEAPARLELTADDLNALIQEGLKSSDFPGKVFVRIPDDRMELEVSISLENVPFLSGRWFNGFVAVKPVVDDGELRLKALDAKANGREVPRQYLDQIEKSLSIKDIETRRGRKSRLQQVLEKARTVKIEDGKVVLER